MNEHFRDALFTFGICIALWAISIGGFYMTQVFPWHPVESLNTIWAYFETVFNITGALVSFVGAIFAVIASFASIGLFCHAVFMLIQESKTLPRSGGEGW